MLPKAIVAGSALLILQCGVVALISLNERSESPQSVPPPRIRIEPSTIELARMRLGERRYAKAYVHNDSDAPVHLKTITTCGCVRAELSGAVVAAGQKTELNLAITAPVEPKEIRQRVIVECIDAPGFSWTTDITGKSEADVWSVPSRIDAVLDGNGDLAVDLLVRWIDSTGPVTIKSKSELVQVVPLSEGLDSRHVRLHFKKATEGESSLSVFRRDGSFAADVPLRWQRRADVLVRPEHVWITKNLSTGALRKTLFLFVDPFKEDRRVVITPLKPWVKLIRQRTLNRHAVELQIEIDVKSAQPGVEPGSPILAVQLNGPNAREYFLKGYFSK